MKSLIYEGFEKLKTKDVFISHFAISLKAIQELEKKGLAIKITVINATDKSDDKSAN